MLKIDPFLSKPQVPNWLRLGSLPPHLRVSAAVRTAAQKKQRDAYEFEIRELQHQVQQDLDELASMPDGMEALRAKLREPLPAPPSEVRLNEGEAIAGLLGLLKGESQQTNRLLYGKAQHRQINEYENNIKNREWERRLAMDELGDLEDQRRTLERRVDTSRGQELRLNQSMRDLDADTLKDLLRLHERGTAPPKVASPVQPSSMADKVVTAYWKQLERGVASDLAMRAATVAARQYQSESGLPEESSAPVDVLQAAKSVRVRNSELYKGSTGELPRAAVEQSAAAKNVLFHELVSAEDSLQKASTQAERLSWAKRVNHVQRVIDESEQAELEAQLARLNQIPPEYINQDETDQRTRIQSRLAGIAARLKNPPPVSVPQSPTVPKTTLKSVVQSWMGTPYKWGGTSRSGIDCSAFTQSVLATQGMQIPRTAEAQYRDRSGVAVPWKDLQPGDILYFHKTTRAKDPGRASHCGIYMGNGQFAHASSGRGVTVTSVESKFYKSRFLGAKRFTPSNR
jgi:lipoprotein Spr